MTDATMAIRADAGSALLSVARPEGRGNGALAQGGLYAPHIDHATRASNSDVAVAWLAVLPLGAALLLALVS